MSHCTYTNPQRDFPAFNARDVADFSEAFKVIEAESSLDALSEKVGAPGFAPAGAPLPEPEVENEIQFQNGIENEFQLHHRKSKMKITFKTHSENENQFQDAAAVVLALADDPTPGAS